jgi:hypothetical protein
MKLGDNVYEDGLFVGYFLKTILYTASNRNRSSPLLLGRIKLLEGAGAGAHTAPPLVGRREWVWIAGVGIPLFILSLAGTWLRMRRWRSVKLPVAPPHDDAEMENWFRNGASQSSAGEAPPKEPLG